MTLRKMAVFLVLVALLFLSACVPPASPGYSLAGPSGNATSATRTIPPVEGSGGTNE